LALVYIATKKTGSNDFINEKFPTGNAFFLAINY